MAILLGNPERISAGDFGSPGLIFLVRGIVGGGILLWWVSYSLPPGRVELILSNYVAIGVTWLFGAALCHLLVLCTAIWAVLVLLGAWEAARELAITIFCLIVAALLAISQRIGRALR